MILHIRPDRRFFSRIVSLGRVGNWLCGFGMQEAQRSQARGLQLFC
jgi:hypothetical protein